MAKVKIQGHASGTGVLTVTAPNTSTDRTITLPDSTGTLIADDGSGNVVLDSGDTLLVKETDSTNNAVRLASDVNEGFVQLYQDGSQTMQIRGNGTTYFNGGNVAINTTTASTNLEIKADDNSTTTFPVKVINSAGTGSTQIGAYAIDTTSVDLTLKAGGNTALTVDKNNGKIGILETSPSFPLHVNGTIKSVGTNNLPALVVDGNSTNEGDIACLDGQVLTFGHHTLDGNTGGFTERLRIQSGGGISFNGDTATANALDDYEEGTWTPTFAGLNSAGTYTYLENQGHYTKIGQQVTVWFNLTNINTSSAGSGRALIKNLPFTVNWQSGFNGDGVGQVALNGFNNVDGNHTFLILADNYNYAQIYRSSGSANSHDEIAATDKSGNSSDVRGFITYIAD